MVKIFFTVLCFIILIFSVSVFAVDLTPQKPIKPVGEGDTKLIEYSQFTTSNLPLYKLPNELGRTWYDYACNANPGRTIAQAYGSGTDGIHFAFMKIATNGAQRFVTYDYWDSSFDLFFGNQSIDESLGRTGWGRVINGANDEVILSHHGGGSHLWTDAGEASYSFTENHSVTGGVFPGIAVKGDTVVIISNMDGTNYSFVPNDIQVSTDYMQTWTTRNLAPLDPLATEYGPTEMWPSFNSNGDLAIVYTPDVTATSPDGSVKISTTNDLCATWTNTVIYDAGVYFPTGTFLTDKTSYFYNPWHMFSMYGKDDTYHCVFGGIQGGADTSSTQFDYFPILYWNTREQQLVDLAFSYKSNPADTTAPGILVNSRPGNGLGGMNYPILSEGPNGELVCIWQEWEADSSGSPVMATPTGGTAIFCTDIWGAYSPDGGQTWSDPFFVAGTPGESDVYPNIAKNFSFNATNDSMVLDVVYLWDTNVGVGEAFIGNSDPSECVLFYEQVTIYAPGGVNSIDENEKIVNTFRLSQNYPNPFNPITNISFTVSKATNVTLDVFNTIGEKVATLVNGSVNAGKTVVTFNGEKHSSGVYFYQLTTGNVVETRKMLLVK